MLVSFYLLLQGSFLQSHELAPHMVFHTSKETLDTVKDIISKKEKGVYLRLGDGEINVAVGGGAIEQIEQRGSRLQAEMQEAFLLNEPNVLKALPLNCKEFGGFEQGMYEGVHYWPYHFCRDYLTKAKRLWGKEVTDVYSQVAMHHLIINDQPYTIDFFKFLKGSNCTLFVGNENIPAHIRTALFGSQCRFIPTPRRDAYRHIDRLEKECLEALSKTSDYQVVVITAGPAGIILQKRLWKKVDNVFLFNLGSVVDLLCGWNNSRAWIQLVKNSINVQDFLRKVA